MAIPRRKLVDLNTTPFYHVVSRCVRRSFLSGYDELSGQDFSHRKQWIVDRMKYLSSIFAISLPAYAVMSNHYHMVLYVDKSKAEMWDNQEIFSRGKLLFRQKAKELESVFEHNPQSKILVETLDLWRKKLADISYFMKYLNEYIAKKANLEDECTGHFWESRFKSHALLDEGAVLSAMVYVDLNPVRAGIANTPEESEYTSIKERIDKLRTQTDRYSKTNDQPIELFNHQNSKFLQLINFDLLDYIKLVDETGRVIRNPNKGSISSEMEPILSRLGLYPGAWYEVTQHLERNYATVIGSESSICQSGMFTRPPRGIKLSRKMYFDKKAA